MLDKEVRERFKEFQKRTGKHDELYIDDVRFEEVSLADKKYFEFAKGKNKYIQRYIKANKGEYPILGSSLKNDCISAYITPIDLDDIINQKCVSFNKDNAKGSVPFYRDYPFLMDRHHIAIIPNEDLVDAHYIQMALIRFFETKKFGWGDNVADVSAVQSHSIPIPKDLSKFYPSYKIQEAIVEFLEDGFARIERIRANIDKRYNLVERLEKSLIPSVFIRDYIKVSFGKYTKERDIGFDIMDVEFEKFIFKDFFIFKGGNSKYKKSYYINSSNKGDYPLVTGSTTIVDYIKPINPNDVFDAPAISYNKDNDKGSIAFYHKIPFIAGGHHYVLQLKDNFNNDINLKYSYYVLSNHFAKNMYFQSKEPRANSGLIQEVDFLIPKPLNNYTSLEIQTIIADFIETKQKKIQRHHDKLEVGYDALRRLHKTYLARTFILIDWEVR